MTLEELAKWLDDNAVHLEMVAGTIASDMRMARKYRAGAAACRELANLRSAIADAETEKYDELCWGRLLDLHDISMKVVTDAALAEISND